MYLWRAVNSEGEVLDVLVQSRRDRAAALRFMRKLLKNQRIAPLALVADRAEILWICRPRARLRRRAHSGQAQKQPGGKFACADPTAGAEDAGLPLARLGPALLCCPHCHPSPVPRRGLRCVARGCGACCLIKASACPSTGQRGQADNTPQDKANGAGGKVAPGPNRVRDTLRRVGQHSYVSASRDASFPSAPRQFRSSLCPQRDARQRTDPSALDIERGSSCHVIPPGRAASACSHWLRRPRTSTWRSRFPIMNR